MPHRRLALRLVWVSLGCVCVLLGALGILVPGLPTTPFLILATACFARSSRRLHRWLCDNRWFGPAIRSFYAGEGVSARIKLLALGTMWAFVTFAVLVGIPGAYPLVKIVVVGAAIVGTVYLLRLPTRRVGLAPVAERERR